MVPDVAEDISSADKGSPTKSEAPPKRAGICGQVVVLLQREPVGRGMAFGVLGISEYLRVSQDFMQLEMLGNHGPRYFQ